MQCKTDDCTEEAVAALVFPFAIGSQPAETLACSRHVEAAKQLMTNLDRLPELKVIPLPPPEPKPRPELKLVETTAEASPGTERPPVEASAVDTSIGRSALELEALVARSRCIELEIELERQRQSRIGAETELVSKGRALFDHVVETVKDFVAAQWPGLLEQVKAAASAGATAAMDENELSSVVDGPTTSPEPTHQPESPGPEQAPEAPPPPTDPNEPPREP